MISTSTSPVNMYGNAVERTTTAFDRHQQSQFIYRRDPNRSSRSGSLNERTPLAARAAVSCPQWKQKERTLTYGILAWKRSTEGRRCSSFPRQWYVLISFITSAFKVCSCRSRWIISSNKRFVASTLSQETLVMVSMRIPRVSRGGNRPME